MTLTIETTEAETEEDIIPENVRKQRALERRRNSDGIHRLIKRYVASHPRLLLVVQPTGERLTEDEMRKGASPYVVTLQINAGNRMLDVTNCWLPGHSLEQVLQAVVFNAYYHCSPERLSSTDFYNFIGHNDYYYLITGWDRVEKLHKY